MWRGVVVECGALVVLVCGEVWMCGVERGVDCGGGGCGGGKCGMCNQYCRLARLRPSNHDEYRVDIRSNVCP